MGSQLNVLLLPYYYIVKVLTTDKEKTFSKNNKKGLEVHSEIYQIRREAGGKGRGRFRNI